MSCQTLVVFFFIFISLFSQQQVGAEISKEEQKAFDALVKVVENQAGGFVHPSIGIVAPAPSGAPRGIGIVKDIKKQINNDILIKIPYSYQMTRELALSTLTPLVPAIVLVDLPLIELDDAALLVLLLAHEYGLGKKSKFHAYINTLPLEDAGCGWADLDDFRKLPPGVGVEDVEAAVNYAHRVSNGMAKDYGEYLSTSSWPKEWKKDPAKALQWALCIVNSRATAANGYSGGIISSEKIGVRLIPLADLANHQFMSGGFIELSGNERIANGDFVDATSLGNDDVVGSFLVRSIWKDGASRELLKGDEITVNYNLPGFGPVDWFLSLGFVPPEIYRAGHDEF